MKKTKVFFTALLALVAMGTFTACEKTNGINHDNEVVIATSELPSNAQLFISDFFQGYAVQSATKSNSSYNVTLAKTPSNAPTKSVQNNAAGYKIKFGLDGEWIEIEGNNDSALPDAVLALVPSTIVSYVNEFHVGRAITEIEKTTYGYYVELTGRPDVELQFDSTGTIIRSTTGDDDDDRNIAVGELPAAAQQFLSTYFGGISVREASADNDSYDVELSNGTDIEFDLLGNWVKVETDNSAIPAAFVANELPSAIGPYIAANYPNNRIEEVKRGVSAYKIELRGDIELVFDNAGNLWTASGTTPGGNYGEGRVDFSELPQSAQDVLNAHFLTTTTLLYAERDDNEYEVRLADGTEVDFRLNGDLKKVDVLPGRAVPAGVVLPAIASYVATNYANRLIEEYEIEQNGYKVGLSGYNDIELLFNSNGNFIGIDD